MQHDLEKEAKAAMRLLRSEAVAVKMDPSRKDILIESGTDLIEALQEIRQELLCLEDAIAHHKKAEAHHKRQRDEAEERMAALRARVAEALYPVGKVVVDNKAVIPSKSPDSVVITDKAAIPEGLMAVETVVEPDKAAIKEALKNGEAVPGAELVTGKVKVAI